MIRQLLWTLALALAWCVSACGVSHRREPPAAPTEVPVHEPAAYDTPELEKGPGNLCKIDPSSCAISLSGASEMQLTGPLAGAPAVRAYNDSVASYASKVYSAVSGSTGSTTPAAQAAPPAPLPAGKRPDLAARSIDIEAHVEIEVPRVSDAIPRVVAMVRAAGGELVNEAVEDRRSVAGASLSLRVPSERVLTFLDGLRALGRLRSRRVESTELGRKQRDAQVLLAELELTRKRYEELMAKAQNVSEMTSIEESLAETRTAIDRVKNDIAWMNDRAARSTVYVTLYAKSPEEGLDVPEPKLHPGVRLDTFVDVPPHGQASSFIGGGVSMWFLRAFSFDLDLMSGLGGPNRQSGVDLLIATVGGELYSDYLGGGRRRFFNPFFGFRAGYARSAAHDQLVLGGTLGVEIVRSEAFFVDFQSRLYGLIGPSDGVHFGVQPFLGLNFAY